MQRRAAALQVSVREPRDAICVKIRAAAVGGEVDDERRGRTEEKLSQGVSISAVRTPRTPPPR